MTQRRLVRHLVAIVLIAGLLAATIGTLIHAASISARSIEGQDGWSGGTLPVSASIDQVVDQSGANQRTGTGAWRISNNTSLGGYNGNFAGWVFGPGLPVSAGQPSSGAVANQFTATVWFRSASASADGSNIEIDLGNPEGNDRNTFLAVTNRADGVDGGLQLRVSEPDGATGNFRPTVTIATGITRSVYHRLDIVANFQDGSANDTVAYTLDGVLLVNPVGGTTFGTFEGWRDGLQFAYSQSNRLFFRSGAAPSAFGAFLDTAAQGFYFDDLFYAVAQQSAPAIRLAAYATGFEPGFSAGSIQGQEAWSGGTLPIAAAVDQTVDQSGLNQRTGTGAWRISNNTSLGGYNGNFAGWVFGPSLPVSAGQPSSLAVADQFTATLWFRSASASADGSNMEIDLGSVAGDDRNTFLAVTNRADADGGLQLRVSEPDGATGNFLPTVVIATGITRGVYHRLDILAKFQDGPANDTVEYSLDGVPVPNPGGGTTFGTFEGWRDGLQSPYVLSNRLFFRSGPAPSAFGAFADTAAQGFYFDDLFYSVANQSAPGTALAAYATGFEPPAIPAPDLTISKSHVGNFTQGEIGAQFTIMVTNSGTPSTIGVVTLTDTVPTGLTPTAASGTGWTCTLGATVTCTRSDALAPGASYPPVAITVNVAASAPASVTNTATISGGGDVNTANNTASDVTTILPPASQPDLTITKSHVGNFTQGQNGEQFTLTVTNSATPSTIGVVTLTDTVPSGLTPAAASGAGWTCTVAGATVTCTRSDALAPGASYPPVAITVNVAASAPASVTNTATISGGGDVNTANNTASDVTTILPAASFEPGFSPGSIEGQEGWSGGTIPISASVDQTVDQSGANQRTGTGAWRISNNTSLGNLNGAFAGWVFGPGLLVSAGQPSSGAAANQFTATLWFRSASATADGSNMEIDLGSVAGDDRNTFLAVTNRADGVDGGLQLRVSEPDGATGNFRPTVSVATGITRGVYHRLDIVASFTDGPANDTLAYALDGVPLINPVGGGTTFGTFEGFRDFLGSPYVLSNRLFFRSGAAPSAFGAFADTAAQGFYFDDLFYSVANQSAPGTALAAYTTGFEPHAIPAPDLTITKSHVGNFVQGQIGAPFTVTVTNSGTPSTIGIVTLTDAVPSGLTPTTASGTGWTCTVTGATVTCTRSDALAPGASYPPVTIAVNVAANAPASVTNTATVSGGGDVNTTNNTATDVTTILPATSTGVVTAVASFFAFDPAFRGGVSVAAGDVTGDGVADIITGAGPGGGPNVRVFSLASGVLTQVASFFAYDPAFTGGVHVTVGDVNGDGVADIITGAGPGGGPHVKVFSLAGGVVTQVASFFAYDAAFLGGISVAAGDVNGDGVAEIVTGAGPGGGPHVKVFSLAGGVVTGVASFLAYDPAFLGGVDVAAGDVTGDGVADIITGAGPGGGPNVRAFSLAGGSVTGVASFFAYDPAFLGGVHVAAADLTGDGVAEIITGAGSGGGPHVRAFSLAGGSVTGVASFFAYDPAFLGGVYVAAADLTRDGVAEIITGAGPGGGPHVRVLDVSGVTVK